MYEATYAIPVRLQSGQLIKIQVSPGPREEDVAFRPVSLQGLADTMGGIATEIFAGLKRVHPDKITVEFGVEVALEAGQLTALVLKGTGAANFTISMEWSANGTC